MLPKRWFLLAALVVLILPFSSLAAQDQPTISIALPENLRNIVDESTFSDFETANNVKVYVNYVSASIPPISAGADAYLDGVASYVSSADVLYVNDFSYAATRAGYILDLSPLTSTDPNLNPDDFYPAAWNSVQWEGGVWALPVSIDATMLIYDPDSFDQAGIPYPSDRWSMDDLASAAKALTQYDSNGNVSVPGLSTFGSTAALFRSLYGKNFFDDSGNPSFDDQTLEDMLTTWQDLVSSGVVGSTFTGGSNQVPMRIMGSFGLRLPRGSNQTAPVALALPGGSVGLSMDAVAVSSGTQQPELAYALAEFISNNTQFTSLGLTGGVPARQSLAGQQSNQNGGGNFTTGPGGNAGGGNASGGPGGGGGRAVQVFGGNSPEVQAALDQLLPDALTLNDEQYSDYVNSALNLMSSQSLDAHTALQQAEAQAISDLQTASDRRSSVNVVVATPPPPVVLQPGEIALNFGIQGGPVTANLDQWQQLGADFASTDPEVGEVNIDTQGGGVNQFAQNDDCFYLGSNAVPGLDETTIINLDPYLDTDPNFDPNDVIAGVMAQIQKDNHTWAYPLTIQAQTMSYNQQIFQQAGVQEPSDGWTVDQFANALQTLTDYLQKPAFVPRDLNGESVMMLVAAYGGLPIDYRTNPITINFTDSATVNAIQQVLDLAKNGYISYQPIISGGGFRIVAGGDTSDAITTDALAGIRRFLGGGGSSGRNTYRMVTFPTGIYNAASYTIGTGYISATAQNSDACYRWLSYLAQHVTVFGDMPVRLSQINDPNMQQSFGDNASFYSSFAQELAAPNTIIFPTAAGGNVNVSDFIVQFWLNRAFDNYISNDADLNAELSDAQTYADAFEQCIQALPPEDQTGGGGGIALNTSTRDCATTADPTMNTLFSAAGG